MTPDCKDCRWSRRSWFSRQSRRCRNPKALGNQIQPFVAFCSIERDSFFANLGCCGSSGRYFAPRIPLWRRILSKLRVLP